MSNIIIGYKRKQGSLAWYLSYMRIAHHEEGCVYDPETQGCAVGPGCDSEDTTCHPIHSKEPFYTSNQFMIPAGVGIILFCVVITFFVLKKMR